MFHVYLQSQLVGQVCSLQQYTNNDKYDLLNYELNRNIRVFNLCGSFKVGIMSLTAFTNLAIGDPWLLRYIL